MACGYEPDRSDQPARNGPARSGTHSYQAIECVLTLLLPACRPGHVPSRTVSPGGRTDVRHADVNARARGSGSEVAHASSFRAAAARVVSMRRPRRASLVPLLPGAGQRGLRGSPSDVASELGRPGGGGIGHRHFRAHMGSRRRGRRSAGRPCAARSGRGTRPIQRRSDLSYGSSTGWMSRAGQRVCGAASVCAWWCRWRGGDFDASPAGEPFNSLEAQPQAGTVAVGVDVKVWFGGVS